MRADDPCDQSLEMSHDNGVLALGRGVDFKSSESAYAKPIAPSLASLRSQLRAFSGESRGDACWFSARKAELMRHRVSL
jgi:hypothetical protein